MRLCRVAGTLSRVILDFMTDGPCQPVGRCVASTSPRGRAARLANGWGPQLQEESVRVLACALLGACWPSDLRKWWQTRYDSHAYRRRQNVTPVKMQGEKALQVTSTGHGCICHVLPAAL